MRRYETLSNTKIAIVTLSLMLIASSPLSSAQSFRVIHSFGAPGDGATPSAGLVLDGQGNLYGTTGGGGPNGLGTVFELQPNQNGTWSEDLIKGFSGSDGCAPAAPVSCDAAGNLYATTSECPGRYGGGTVVELLPCSGGWEELLRAIFAGT